MTVSLGISRSAPEARHYLHNQIQQIYGNILSQFRQKAGHQRIRAALYDNFSEIHVSIQLYIDRTNDKPTTL